MVRTILVVMLLGLAAACRPGSVSGLPTTTQQPAEPTTPQTQPPQPTQPLIASRPTEVLGPSTPLTKPPPTEKPLYPEDSVPQAIEQYNRGLAHHEQGQLDLAIEAYTLATTLDPQYAQAYASRGTSYADQGDLDRAIADYDQAIADFDRVIALDPQHAGAYSLRGMTFARIGEREKAISDLETALDLGLEPGAQQRAEALLQELKQ